MRIDKRIFRRSPLSSFKIACGVVGLLLALSGCDLMDESLDEFEAEVIVESYQVAGETLKPVFLSHTVAVDDIYDFRQHAISGASVRVSLLDAQNAPVEVIPYVESDTLTGMYVPDGEHVVQPLGSYRLDADVVGFEAAVSATTVVPDTFHLISSNVDTLEYLGSEQLELIITRSNYPNRQNIFVFEVEALLPMVELLTPFAASVFEDLLDGENLDELVSGSSPPLNEGNYDPNPDGTLTLKIPWFSFSFFGPNRLTANAIDDNLLDFYRSQLVQQGGSTFSPGEIPNVLEKVDGGRGVFGSYADITFDTFIIPAGFEFSAPQRGWE